MSELKACAHCGHEAQPIRYEYKNGEIQDLAYCPNDDCPMHHRTLSIEAWQTRPIEDALTARIAELEGERRWIPVGEKPLEAGTFFVLLKNGEVTKDFTFIDGGRYYWWNHGANITHYMPLPTPPEAK